MILGREIKLPIDVWAGQPDDSRIPDDSRMPGNSPMYAQKLQDKMNEVHMFAT